MVSSVVSDVKQAVTLFSASFDRDKTALVSVIICTYNRPDYLSKAIDSVVGGTYTNVETIVSSNLDSAETREVANPLTTPVYDYAPTPRILESRAITLPHLLR